MIEETLKEILNELRDIKRSLNKAQTERLTVLRPPVDTMERDGLIDELTTVWGVPVEDLKGRHAKKLRTDVAKHRGAQQIAAEPEPEEPEPEEPEPEEPEPEEPEPTPEPTPEEQLEKAGVPVPEDTPKEIVEVMAKEISPKASKYTDVDVKDALIAFARAHSKEEAVAIRDKYTGGERVHFVKEEDYEAIMADFAGE